MLREIAVRLALAEVITAPLRDARDRNRVRHSYAEMATARMLMIAAGYEDCGVHNWRQHAASPPCHDSRQGFQFRARHRTDQRSRAVDDERTAAGILALGQGNAGAFVRSAGCA